MTAREYYNVSSKADAFGTFVFYFVLVLSTGLLVFSNPVAESWLHPGLIALAILAVACTVITTIYQTEGNRILRLGQLSDAFGAGIGNKTRADYYNNNVPKTTRRLAATTLENTFFTGEILQRILARERIKNGRISRFARRSFSLPLDADELAVDVGANSFFHGFDTEVDSHGAVPTESCSSSRTA